MTIVLQLGAAFFFFFISHLYKLFVSTFLYLKELHYTVTIVSNHLVDRCIKLLLMITPQGLICRKINDLMWKKCLVDWSPFHVLYWSTHNFRVFFCEEEGAKLNHKTTVYCSSNELVAHVSFYYCDSRYKQTSITTLLIQDW